MVTLSEGTVMAQRMPLGTAERPNSTSATPGSSGTMVYLGLGSNQGERDDLLRAALSALAPFVAITHVSSVYDTAPELVLDQPRFHNAASAGVTLLEPLPLLHALKGIESTLGRTPGRRYGPRAIDIDILLYDELTLNCDELTIPHPRLAERAFALLPLAEIAPNLLHPTLGVTIHALAAPYASADVRRLGPLR